MTTVKELRDELVNNGMPKIDADNIKGKDNLLAALREQKDTFENNFDVEESIYNTTDSIVASDNETTEPQPEIPARSAYEWPDYVMSHFHEEELYNGSPTVDGLRRVVELILGEIISTQCKVVQVPTRENWQRATVEYAVTIEYDGILHTFADAADAYRYNVVDDKKFSNHPVALASTRAEGRVLRKALRLRKIVAAEEVSSEDIDHDKVDMLMGDFNIDTKVTDIQIKTINKLCKTNNVNVLRFINAGAQQYESIREILKITAMEMIRKLNDWQQLSEDDKYLIPQSLIGFTGEVND